MKVQRKYSAIILLLLCTILIFTNISPVYAKEKVNNRMLIITATLDPRVKADKLSVYLIFRNKHDGSMINKTLVANNGYYIQDKVPAGDYELFSGMVMNDTTGYYFVKCDDFDTYKATTKINVIVGNPDYKGKIVESNHMLGDIDREATNAIRKEHGYPPIDWDEVDKRIEEGEFDLDKILEEGKAEEDKWKKEHPGEKTPDRVIGEKMEEQKKHPDGVPDFTIPSETKPNGTKPDNINPDKNNPDKNNPDIINPDVTNPEATTDTTEETNPDGTTIKHHSNTDITNPNDTTNPSENNNSEETIQEEQEQKKAMWIAIIFVVVITLIIILTWFIRFKRSQD